MPCWVHFRVTVRLSLQAGVLKVTTCDSGTETYGVSCLVQASTLNVFIKHDNSALNALQGLRQMSQISILTVIV